MAPPAPTITILHSFVPVFAAHRLLFTFPHLFLLKMSSTPTDKPVYPNPLYYDPIQAASEASHRNATQAEKKRRRVYRWKLILALLLPNFLAAVDITIVAPALPTIASTFSMIVATSERATTKPFCRQASRRVELDRHGIHPHVHIIHPRVWTACRHLRPPYRLPNLPYMHAYR